MTKKPDKPEEFSQKLANFFFELGTLRKTARSHRQTLLTDDLSDNISSHSYRVTMIGWFLANLENADPYKVVTMCLFHDTGESRSGDQNWVHKKFVKVFEDEIHDDQLKSLPHGEDLHRVNQEYHERKTKEAIITKDADLIDQILLLKEYAWQGNQEASAWLHEKITDNAQYRGLQTASAKKLARRIFTSKPSDWWSDLWTPNRR